MTVLYYDLNEVLINRYPKRIALSLQERESDISHVFVYSEIYNEEIVSLPEIKNSSVYFLPKLRSNDLRNLYERYEVDCIIVCAQRIPDMWLIAYFKSVGVSTYLVQHGLWADHLQRLPLPILLVTKLGKFINYFTFTLYTSRVLDLNWFFLNYDLYRFLLIERKGFKDLPRLSSTYMGADKVFAFDASWSDYYHNKYGYQLNQIDYIGNPDVVMLKNISIKYLSDEYVVYVAQTLVEDGRMALRTFQEFLTGLLEVCRLCGKTLVIRRHPRTRNEIYSDISDDIILTDEMPACKKYVGHYSGLLSTVQKISSDIFLWHFESHHMPSYFNRFAYRTGSSWDCLDKWMKEERDIKVNISFPNIVDPINNITQKIVKYENVK